jgi:hypothetical protein
MTTVNKVNVDGYVDERGIEYWGKAIRQSDGTWQCLANVDGALCRVEVSITLRDSQEGREK